MLMQHLTHECDALLACMVLREEMRWNEEEVLEHACLNTMCSAHII